MNQVTLSRFWYGCDNGMTDFVVSRSRWKFWSYSQSLSTSNKTEKNILSRILCASFCTWYVIKIAKVYLCPIYYRSPPILSFVITLTFYSIHFHFDEFRIDFNSAKRFETKASLLLLLLRKKKLADYRQIEILKFETCFHGNGGAKPSNLDEKSSCQSFLFLLAVMWNPVSLESLFGLF